jgi:hypothetical protein
MSKKCEEKNCGREADFELKIGILFHKEKFYLYKKHYIAWTKEHPMFMPVTITPRLHNDDNV